MDSTGERNCCHRAVATLLRAVSTYLLTFSARLYLRDAADAICALSVCLSVCRSLTRARTAKSTLVVCPCVRAALLSCSTALGGSQWPLRRRDQSGLSAVAAAVAIAIAVRPERELPPVRIDSGEAIVSRGVESQTQSTLRGPIHCCFG